uniref:Uncharacterized protein n=1 Tax=viral metagenome TaxID=1070528 RepID=A0A6M3LV66_9ZZZZ
MKATCFIGGRLRINIPVVRKNTYTVWVQTTRKINRYGKEITTFIKRHIKKHNVVLSGEIYEGYVC